MAMTLAEKLIQQGKLEMLRQSIEDLCEAFAIQLDEARRASIAELGLAELNALRIEIKAMRDWPDTLAGN